MVSRITYRNWIFPNDCDGGFKNDRNLHWLHLQTMEPAIDRVGGEHHFGGVARNEKNDEALLSDMEHAKAVILFFDTTA